MVVYLYRLQFIVQEWFVANSKFILLKDDSLKDQFSFHFLIYRTSKLPLHSLVVRERSILGMRVRQNYNIIDKTREKPQGVGFIFLLASTEIRGKKPHPPGAFREEPLYYLACALFNQTRRKKSTRPHLALKR